MSAPNNHEYINLQIANMSGPKATGKPVFFVQVSCQYGETNYLPIDKQQMLDIVEVLKEDLT
ncbi:MAG: hypothetical protein KAS32_24810 [Candidatus Peribacteraceae bacterium]|nr:hypothetical protein [Candidatus Peribacteraceae bacterium]